MRDIHYGNYLRVKLVDFTEPGLCITPSLDLMRPGAAHSLRKQEVLDLEQLIYDFWPQNSSIMPEDFTLPQGLLNCTGYNFDACGAGPFKYDWRARMEEDFEPEELFLHEEQK